MDIHRCCGLVVQRTYSSFAHPHAPYLDSWCLADTNYNLRDRGRVQKDNVVCTHHLSFRILLCTQIASYDSSVLGSLRSLHLFGRLRRRSTHRAEKRSRDGITIMNLFRTLSWRKCSIHSQHLDSQMRCPSSRHLSKVKPICTCVGIHIADEAAARWHTIDLRFVQRTTLAASKVAQLHILLLAATCNNPGIVATC